MRSREAMGQMLGQILAALIATLLLAAAAFVAVPAHSKPHPPEEFPMSTTAAAALGAPEPELSFDECVALGWRTRVKIADLTHLLRTSHTRVMDTVRRLGLPDRCPVTRDLLESTRTA